MSFIIIVLCSTAILLFVLRHFLYTPITYEDHWMDSPSTHDITFDRPELILSTLGTPTDTQKDQPVLLLCHGYSASTFSWLDFLDYLKESGYTDFHTSLVLLGGHGRDVHAFAKSTWKDWKAPIEDEYKKLVALGYTNISIVGISTGGSLMVRLLDSDFFKTTRPPSALIFIDAYITPRDRTLYLSPFFGFLYHNIPWPDEATLEEEQNWYRNRPYQTIASLAKLVMKNKLALWTGISVPKDTNILIMQSQADPISHPNGALTLQKHLHMSQGTPALFKVNSSKHAFVNLRATPPKDITDTDRQSQRQGFEAIVSFIDFVTQKNSFPEN